MVTPKETLYFGCRVEYVLLEVSLLGVTNINEGILHAKNQRANIYYPMNLAEEHVGPHFLARLLAHQLASDVLLYG